MSFGWKAPRPFKLGGGTRRLVDSMLQTMKQNRPEALRDGGDATEVETENRMLARMLAIGWRDTQRRTRQSDPMRLSTAARQWKDAETGEVRFESPLERWERILNIRPADTDDFFARRSAVAGKFRSYASNSKTDVEGAMQAVFGSWFVKVATNQVSDVDYAGKVPAGNVHAFWATNAFTFTADYPGEFDAAHPWKTALAAIAVHIQPPASVAQAAIDAKAATALGILDDMLPAWMTAVISQLPPGQVDTGFYCGISLVGLTAI